MFCDISLVAACRMVMEVCLTSHGNVVCCLEKLQTPDIERKAYKALLQAVLQFCYDPRAHPMSCERSGK